MAAQSLNTDIDLINAALTATGNKPITTLEDADSESVVSMANFEAVVGAEFAHPWTWTQTTRRLSRIAGDTDTIWTTAWQVPAGVEVDRIEVSGRPVAWESMSDLILTREAEGVVAVGRYRPPVRRWPDLFKTAIVQRLEALFLRALNEDVAAADARDKAADRLIRQARNADSRKRSPRKPATSSLLEARRG
ncbi:hypothetical protein [Azospirillum himalayense]|uniref:Uncharacterized protein n=1 Tax=Azospirillum himalayense TaxID=654847 RepID=A0ABW0G3I0_9PROT